MWTIQFVGTERSFTSTFYHFNFWLHRCIRRNCSLAIINRKSFYERKLKLKYCLACRMLSSCPFFVNSWCNILSKFYKNMDNRIFTTKLVFQSHTNTRARICITSYMHAFTYTLALFGVPPPLSVATWNMKFFRKWIFTIFTSKRSFERREKKMAFWFRFTGNSHFER